MRGAANSRISNKKKTATFARTSCLVTPLKLGNDRAEKPVRGKRAMTRLLRLTRFHHGRDHEAHLVVHTAARLKLPAWLLQRGRWILSPQVGVYVSNERGENRSRSGRLVFFSTLGLRSRYDLLSRLEFLDVRGVLPETSQAASWWRSSPIS